MFPRMVPSGLAVMDGTDPNGKDVSNNDQSTPYKSPSPLSRVNPNPTYTCTTPRRFVLRPRRSWSVEVLFPQLLTCMHTYARYLQTCIERGSLSFFNFERILLHLPSPSCARHPASGSYIDPDIHGAWRLSADPSALFVSLTAKLYVYY